MIRSSRLGFGSVENPWGRPEFRDETFVDNYIPVFSESLIYSSVTVIGCSPYLIYDEQRKRVIPFGVSCLFFFPILHRKTP